MVNIDSSVEQEIEERTAAGNRAYRVHNRAYRVHNRGYRVHVGKMTLWKI